MKTTFQKSARFFALLLSTTFLLNCSQSLNQIISPDPLNTEKSSGAPVVFIAPNSTSGIAAQKTLSTNGDNLVIAKEYRHNTYDRYFLTTRVSDQAAIETGALKNEWTTTGSTYAFYETQIAGSSPVCRFYVPATMTHFYTTNEIECTQFKSNSNFVNEGIEGYAVHINPTASCPSNLKAVYRIFNNANKLLERRHRYTSSPAVLTTLTGQGWLGEGVAFCMAEPAPPVITPPITVGGSTITCGSQSFADIVALKAALSSQSYCVQVNGSMIDFGQDRFGPCMQCQSANYNPPIVPVNPPVVVTCPVISCSAAPVNCSYGARPKNSNGCDTGCGALTCSTAPIVITPPPSVPPSVATGQSFCPNGKREDMTINFNDSIVPFSTEIVSASSTKCNRPDDRNCFHDNLFEAMANQDIVVMKLIIPNGYSTAVTNATSTLPTMAFTNSPVSGYSNRSVSVSKSPCDFSSVTSKLLAQGAFGYAIDIKTPDDTRPAEASLAPGIYYINIRNDNCRAGASCGFDGQFRNWLR